MLFLMHLLMTNWEKQCQHKPILGARNVADPSSRAQDFHVRNSFYFQDLYVKLIFYMHQCYLHIWSV